MNADTNRVFMEMIDASQLNEKEKKIFKMHLGLGTEKNFTVEELMYSFNMTSDQINRIISKVSQLLRHQRRSRKLKDYLSDDFGKHPSLKLQKAFSQRPFQIQVPEKAKIIFLGLDANWDRDIEENDIDFFKENLNYLSDGVKYWKTHSYHTPMLKPAYKGRGGEKYHRVFCKLGFTSNNAEDICFLELLKFCTFGNCSNNRKKYEEMLYDKNNSDHLARICNLFKMENIICVSKGVKGYLIKLGLLEGNEKKVIVHTHFSNFISNDELLNLKRELQEYLNKY